VTAARLVVIACLALGAAPVCDPASAKTLTFAPRVAADASPQASVNWSGYAAVSATTEAVPSANSSLTFGDVTGSWTQPKAHCVKGRADAAAFWVGIGGFDGDSATLQQIGTTAQCSSRGVASSFVWEIVPAGEVRVPLKVRAGDRVTAAVLVNGQEVTMSIKNATRRTRFSTTVTVSQPLDVSSAEWIAEAPTACTSNGICEVVPLTNFGSVTFSNAAATANRVSGTITDPAWLATPLQLIPEASVGGPGASPGALSADGRSFRVSWQRVA